MSKNICLRRHLINKNKNQEEPKLSDNDIPPSYTI